MSGGIAWIAVARMPQPRHKCFRTRATNRPGCDMLDGNVNVKVQQRSGAFMIQFLGAAARRAKTLSTRGVHQRFPFCTHFAQSDTGNDGLPNVSDLCGMKTPA